ncbi:MAG: GlsB/YeaQ/YmgE family stress response membrane protein [Cohaesibacteraceae bacterium]
MEVGLIGFLGIGLLAGFIAEKVMNSNHGLLTNLIVGVIGAYLGPFLAGLLGISFAGFLGSLVIATVGAIVFLFLLRLIKGRR